MADLDVAETTLGWATAAGPGGLAAQSAGWGQAEWAAARRAARIHGVAPLLAARLSGGPAWAALDGPTAAYLAAQRELNGRRVAALLSDLAEILRACAGIDLVPLKGAALAACYYAEPGLRPMADLDLLARPADEPAVDAAMRGLGYRVTEATPRHRAYARGAGLVVDADGEHPANPRGVELHTVVEERLRGIRYTITGQLWAGALPARYAGAAGLSPAPGPLLSHLLIHTSHNLFSRRLRLIQLYDIALVAPALAPADWAAMAAAARSAGEARLLYAPLRLAERMYGMLAPPATMAGLAAGTPAALRRLVEQVGPAEVSLCSPGEASLRWRMAWYRPGADRARALLRALLPAPVELRQLYPQLGGPLALAYGRHLAHAGGWALRRALRRSRAAAHAAKG